MTDRPVSRTPGASGTVALVISLIAVAYGLLARDVFLHETGASGFDTVTLLREGCMGVLVIVGVLLGFRALSSDAPRNRMLALCALALLSPVLGDALAWLVEIAGGRTGRGLFLALSALPLLVALGLDRVSARRAGASPGASPDATPPAADPARRLSGPALWSARLALVLASIVVGLLLCEATFRMFGPGRLRFPQLIVPGSETTSLSRIARMRPYGSDARDAGLSKRFPPHLFMKGWYDQPEWDYFDSDGCVDYVFNRHGLRDNDFDFQKKEGELRIVAIGDSFTFGVGVQLEHIWTEVLERNLEAVHDGPVEVINAGFVSGYTPVGYEKWLTTEGLRLEPDIVIVGLCLNDLHPGIDLYAYRSYKPPATLAGRSELLTHLRRRELTADPQPRAFLGMVRKNPAPKDATEAALLRTKEALEARGIRFVVAVLPMMSGLRDEVYPYDTLIDMVLRDCTGMGIECIDLRDDFLGREDRTLWAHPTDQHPNDIGQRLLGEGIFRYFEEP